MISFQFVCNTLENFWKNYGCTIVAGHDLPMGAATFHPMSVIFPILRNNWKFACLQPCRRPADSMEGLSPNRFAKFHQYQVIIKPAQMNVKEVFLDSIKNILDLNNHHISFIESSWESPTLGAYGLGWEVRCDGMEICQITFFNQMAGHKFETPTLEFAYGVERILLKANLNKDFYNINYDNYNLMNIFKPSEKDMSVLYRQINDIYSEEDFAKEVKKSIILMDNFLPYAAYDNIVNATHIFNCLDSLKLISINKKREYIISIHNLFSRCISSLKENSKL